jgi:outer membrane protein OmpA-like peptidoglycan-associated protein
VPDGYDTCPREPEDRDGDRDDDGCPDNDRDRDGVTDDRDRCPTEPEDTDGFQDDDGCPEADNDGDRVADSADQCGEEPETYNGYQDEDGCPDQLPDRDHDGITDDRDQCPDQAETYNGTTDEDGCPERGPSLVSLEGDQIRILQQVNFATNSDRIVGARSFQVLDAVVAILRAHPELSHVEIQGHTDNRGNADANRDLSQRRANSVMRYLIQHGIEASRLSTRGFGPDQPLEPNTTARGRARNRRVEFHITGPGAAGSQVREPAPAGGATTP